MGKYTRNFYRNHEDVEILISFLIMEGLSGSVSLGTSVQLIILIPDLLGVETTGLISPTYDRNDK